MSNFSIKMYLEARDAEKLRKEPRKISPKHLKLGIKVAKELIAEWHKELKEYAKNR